MSTARLRDTVSAAAVEALAKPPEHRTFADVQAILAGIPLDRIMAWPAPGVATEHDRAQLALEGVDCQLRDGFLIADDAVKGADREPHLLTLGDYQTRSFNLPAERLYAFPAPGTAEVADCEDTKDTIGVICELFDGLLVGKTTGLYESHLAVVFATKLNNYLDQHSCGVVAGTTGTVRFFENQVRAPDASFVEFARLPEGGLTDEPIPPIIPNLVVEVLSKDNRPGEMKRKLDDYFLAGVQLAWYIDPKKQTATIYTAVDKYEEIGLDGVLSGGSTLPGFEVKLGEVFTKASGKRESK